MFSILLLLPAGSVCPSGNLLYNRVLLLQNIRTVFSHQQHFAAETHHNIVLYFLTQVLISAENKIIHCSRKVLVAKYMCISGFDLIRFQATLISEKFSAGHNSCHKLTSIKELRIAKSSEISKHLLKTKKNFR